MHAHTLAGAANAGVAAGGKPQDPGCCDLQGHVRVIGLESIKGYADFFGSVVLVRAMALCKAAMAASFNAPRKDMHEQHVPVPVLMCVRVRVHVEFSESGTPRGARSRSKPARELHALQARVIAAVSQACARTGHIVVDNIDENVPP